MKPLHEWHDRLNAVAADDRFHIETGRGGDCTLRAGDVYFHSRYRPREEAARLVDAAQLDPARPVFVVGLGLGYHVLELQQRGIKDIAVVEPEPAIARLALEAGTIAGEDFLLGIGAPDEIAAADAFRAFARRQPQVLVHPPTARLSPDFAEAVVEQLAVNAFAGQRLHIAVVGPMYGGSAPIAGHIERAFRHLGHQTLFVDNTSAWPLYAAMTASLESKKASEQLGAMLTQYLSEWSYARVAEFDPDICLVMAQAPVRQDFPTRVACHGAITAFWYVENWRHLPYWREVAPHYDYFFHIQPGEFDDMLREAGCPAHAFVQTACDPEVHRPVELDPQERHEFQCDLSFAGAGYHNRVQVFKGLTDYDFKIWGVNWPGPELRHHLCRPEQRFDAALFAKIVAGSKINLNLHSSATAEGVDAKCDAINPRVFEIAACGGFQVCDPAIGLDRHFDFETELPIYRDINELRACIEHFLAHPDERAAFAQRARERVLREHTYEHRAQQMLDLILKRYGKRLLRKGIRVQNTVAEMAERIAPDTSLGQYLRSLPQDMLFTYESIKKHIETSNLPLTETEKIFSYLREVREFAEAVLDIQR
ncbi:MAG TPA: glycosyltransferase [Candidatus Hydrogenedentes bacterium]|nr:glycosyltransferase [Candidatus Hydrogenedentota bacterium]HPG67650.1 glycosyltransferase [Candidatus Hydrogenedentota bacterium]